MNDFTLRKATARDVPEIERVMRESLVGISSRYYDERQVASSLENIAKIDLYLIEDETYFVVESRDGIVGCGGWSKRGKLYAGSHASQGEERLLDPATEPARIRAMFVTPQWERRGIGRAILVACENEARESGFRRVELMAMVSGEAMYAACGYAVVDRVIRPLADGTPMPMTPMVKSLE